MNRIFIASSGDLSDEREKFELLLHREEFKPIVWENIDQSIGIDRFQDRINKYHLHTSDIIIFMVKSRLGKYTQEEFEEAYINLGVKFHKMYVYFFKHDRNEIDEDELFKIISLKKFLRENAEKLYCEVNDFTELENRFHKQKKFFEVDIKPLEIEDISEKESLKQLTKLPPINENFIGREKDLNTLETMLKDESLTYIVNGIGGVGKSELAYRYLHKNKQRYKAIAFIEMTEDSSSIEDVFYTKFKDEFALDSNTSFDDILKKLQKLPSKNLLLIDNLENKEDFEKVKSLNTNFDLLVTTRIANIDTKHKLNLETLNDKDAKELFLSIYDEDSDIEDILAYLDNHPLFINLIAKSLKEEYITLDELRENIKTNAIEKIESTNDKTFKQHLEDTFDRQFKKESNEELKNLLQVISIFPSIELSLETLEKAIGLENLRVKLKKLVDKGWLSKKEDSYKLHQIIRTFIQTDYKLEYENIKFVYENIGKYIDPEDSVLIASQLSHYIPILEHIVNEYKDKKDDTICKVYDSLTYLYYSLGKYDESLSYQKQSFNIRVEIYSEDSIVSAKSFSLMATIYKAMGELEEALKYQKKALEIREETLSEKHPDLAHSYNNISLIYQEMGELEEALKYQKKALEIREEILDEKHPDLAHSYNNLSLIYQEMGELEEALKYQKKALALLKEILDEKHPVLATNYNNISLIYKNMGKLEEAIEFQKKDLEVTKEILGEKHPDLATSYNNISQIYKDLKNCKKAKEFMQKAIDIWSEKDYYNKNILDAKEFLKLIESNIKKQKKAGYKKVGKYCIEM